MSTNNTLVSYLEENFGSYINIRSSGYGWLVRHVKDNGGELLVDTYTSEIKTLVNRERVGQTLITLRHIKEHFNNDAALVALCDECLSAGASHLETLPLTVPNLKVCSEQEFLNFASQLKGSSRVLAHLFYYGNCKVEDLREDKYQLTRLSDGIIEVVANSPRGRVITSDNRWGLTEEECKEISSLFEDFTYRQGGKGREFIDHIFKARSHHWEYESFHLLTSNAIRLLVDGYTQEEVAALQGCRKATLMNRVDRYVNANPSHPLVIAYNQLKAERK